MRKLLWIAGIAALLSAGQASGNTPETLEQALAQAKARKLPVFVDFHAPWCYSCYYMASHVLNGPEWQAAEKRMVVIELDADAPEGHRWMEAWNVKALPSYVVLDATGAELGRILAEQTRAQFYPKLKAILDKGKPLSALQSKAAAGDTAATREVLATYQARFEADAGLRWFYDLPGGMRSTLAADADVALWLKRLELQRAAAAKDSAACLAVGPAVLDADVGCERPYELSRYMGCIAELPQPQQQALLRPQLAPMQTLIDTRIFGDGAACADVRSTVMTMAELETTLGDEIAAEAVLRRAIDQTRNALAGDYHQDRNLADNLRVYLDAAGDTEALDALYPDLIAAWPDDYVYAYRYAKSLAARELHGKALPYFEYAAERAYGANRLTNAKLHAETLHALGRDTEARRVLASALKANGPWFPEQAEALKTQMAALAPTP